MAKQFMLAAALNLGESEKLIRVDHKRQSMLCLFTRRGNFTTLTGCIDSCNET
jgi:hypothetical protein